MNYLKLINLIFYKITLDKSIYIPKMNILSWELLHDEFWAKEVTSNTVCFQCVFKDIWLKMILLQKIMVFLYYMVAYNFLQLNSFRVWDFSLMCDHNFVIKSPMEMIHPVQILFLSSAWDSILMKIWHYWKAQYCRNDKYTMSSLQCIFRYDCK